MKKCVAIIAVLLFLCSFSACTEKNNADATDHLNWVWVRDYPSHGAISDAGYYYVFNGRLHYYDFAVGEDIVLCNKVGCDHSGEECEAGMVERMFLQLLYWNERIWYFDILEPVLYSRDATGLNLKKVGMVASQYIEEGKAVEIGNYVVADGFLYYEADISDKVVTGEGASSTRLVIQSIGRIDLTTGKDEIVYEEKIENPSDEQLILCAAQGNGILLNYWSGKDRDRESADYVGELKDAKSTLLQWNVKTGELTTLFEKSIVECAGVKLVEGGKVFYKSQGNTGTADAGYMYCYDLITGKTEVACPMNTWWIFGGGYVLCTDSQTKEKVVYDMMNGKALPFEPENVAMVCAVASNGFVLRDLAEGKWQYCFVHRESLADGLQKADLQYMNP